MDERLVIGKVGIKASRNAFQMIAFMDSDSCSGKRRYQDIPGNTLIDPCRAYRWEDLPLDQCSDITSLQVIVSRSNPRDEQALCQCFASHAIMPRAMRAVFIGQSDPVQAFCKLFSIDIAKRETDLFHRRGDEGMDEVVGIRKHLHCKILVQLRNCLISNGSSRTLNRVSNEMRFRLCISAIKRFPPTSVGPRAALAWSNVGNSL